MKRTPMILAAILAALALLAGTASATPPPAPCPQVAQLVQSEVMNADLLCRRTDADTQLAFADCVDRRLKIRLRDRAQDIGRCMPNARSSLRTLGLLK